MHVRIIGNEHFRLSQVRKCNKQNHPHWNLMGSVSSLSGYMFKAVVGGSSCFPSAENEKRLQADLSRHSLLLSLKQHTIREMRRHDSKLARTILRWLYVTSLTFDDSETIALASPERSGAGTQGQL